MDNPEKLTTESKQDEDKQNKYNTSWTPLYANKQKNANTTWALLQTTGGNNEPNIVFIRIFTNIKNVGNLVDWYVLTWGYHWSHIEKGLVWTFPDIRNHLWYCEIISFICCRKWMCRRNGEMWQPSWMYLCLIFLQWSSTLFWWIWWRQCYMYRK